jgi:hypothetical protein
MAAVFVAGVACLGAGGGFVANRYYYLLSAAERCNDPDLLVYRLDGVHRLVFGDRVALLINTQEHVVVSLPVAGRRWGSVGLWPRDEAKGVVLGDGVQGYIDDSYHFDARGVDIVYTSGSKRNAVRVEL